jgi:CoA:oxalate CoA-transferase
VALLEPAGVPYALVQTVADAVEHPQTRARNMVVESGGLRMAGNPIKLAGFADPPTRGPAPELDADGDRIRREFGEG